MLVAAHAGTGRVTDATTVIPGDSITGGHADTAHVRDISCIWFPGSVRIRGSCLGQPGCDCGRIGDIGRDASRDGSGTERLAGSKQLACGQCCTIGFTDGCPIAD